MVMAEVDVDEGMGENINKSTYCSNCHTVKICMTQTSSPLTIKKEIKIVQWIFQNGNSDEELLLAVYYC